MASTLRQRPAVARKISSNDDEGSDPQSDINKNTSPLSVSSETAQAEPAAAPTAKPKGCPVNRKGRSWVRKAAVILIPAYTLCVMFQVLEPPALLLRHAVDDIQIHLGMDPKIFSAEHLKALSGGKRPMLSILGEVFDVSKGAKHYGVQGAYRGFTGRDASRAFVTGDFSEGGLIDDVTGLEPSQCLGIKDWLSFYKNEADKYKRRGVLVGNFYDKEGKPTQALKEFERCATKGKLEKEREDAEKKLYPSCNSRWAAAEGGKVWCEDAKKVPRKIPKKTVHGADIRSAGSLGGRAAAGGGSGDGEQDKDARTAKGRCACFDPDYAKANEARLLSYGGCPPDANLCVTKPPDPSKTKGSRSGQVSTHGLRE